MQKQPVVVAVLTAVMIAATGCAGPQRSDDPARPDSTAATESARNAAAVAYFDATKQTVHRTDGSPVRLDLKADVFSFTELADGRLLFVVARQGDGVAAGKPPVAELLVLDAKGRTLDRFAAWGYGLTATADGRLAAWIGPAGTPMVLQSRVSKPVKLDPMTDIAGSPIEPVQVSGDCAGDGGCSVYAVDTTANSNLWESSTVHPAQRYAGDGGIAVSPDGRFFLARTSASDDEQCVGLWDRQAIGGEADPDPLGEECMHGMLGPDYEFSPDGRWIIAQHGEGYAPTTTQILDGRTLEVVATASEKGASYHDAAWEDSTSVLLVVDHDQRGLETRRYELQRLHRDGKVEKLGIRASNLASR